MKINKGFLSAAVLAVLSLFVWSPANPENGRKDVRTATEVYTEEQTGMLEELSGLPDRQSRESLSQLAQPPGESAQQQSGDAVSQLAQLPGEPVEQQSGESVKQRPGESVVQQSDESAAQQSREAVGQPTSEAVEQQSSEAAIQPEQQPEKSAEQEVEQILSGLSLREKVAQMFVVLPEQLTGVDGVTAAGETTRNAINELPVGGLIYLEQNLISEEQITEMISGVQKFSLERTGLPMFLCVDEEGGTVLRISGRGISNVPYIENMSEVGQNGDTDRAYEIGSEMGGYLSRMGFNVDLAPVADVLSNPSNSVVRYRSFGSDPQMVADMVTAVMDGLWSEGIYGTLKHFPGHGATEGDTHEGYASSPKTLEEMRICELVPFQEGIDHGADFIMVGHISLPNVIGDNTPASLSHEIITKLLREEMGFDGIVITDALNMGAISQRYSSAEAAIRTVEAGTDLILVPVDLQAAYNGILEAVNDGTLTRERIDESVRRILKVKLEMKGSKPQVPGEISGQMSSQTEKSDPAL